jgi:hypothetical protein
MQRPRQQDDTDEVTDRRTAMEGRFRQRHIRLGENSDFKRIEELGGEGRGGGCPIHKKAKKKNLERRVQ